MAAFAVALMSGNAFADDNEKWINQCILDNTDQGQTSEVLKEYCTCMNGKMSVDETRSVTEWEKANVDEAVACENQAGWVAK